MNSIIIRNSTDADKTWIESILNARWGSVVLVTRGVDHIGTELPALIAIHRDKPVGLVTYRFANAECEIVSLDSLLENQGVGSALLNGIEKIALQNKYRRIWLITTNDNLHALRFYQKRGFTLAAVYPNALERSRELKPQIPIIGMEGIPLRDEIELEKILI